MAPNPLWSDATIIAAVAAVTPLLNSGFVAVYSGAQPALNGALTGVRLAEATFGATAFGAPAAAAGTVTANANAIASGTIAATGTAGYVALLKSDNATAVMTGSVATAAADLVVNTTAFVSGANFAVSSGAISQVQT